MLSNKPKILIHLERKILKDLAMLGPNDDPIEFRLKVFRETFKSLTENVKTFGPLLAQIKAEYEAVIKHYKSEAKYEEMRGDGIQRELDKLKEEISTDDEKTDKRLGLDRSVETLVKIKQEKERRTRHDQRSRTIGIFKSSTVLY